MTKEGPGDCFVATLLAMTSVTKVLNKLAWFDRGRLSVLCF
jgi:hypothetical protein